MRELFRNILWNLWSKAIVSFSKETDFVEIYDKTIKEVNILSSQQEALFLFKTAKAMQKMDGIYIEVGTYQGATAKIICKAKGNKEFHVFDAFESGLENPTKEDRKEDNPVMIRQGVLGTPFTFVKALLGKYPETYVHKGYFPETGEPIKDKKIAFANIDIDLYAGTKKSMEFIYPRMTTGGIMVLHDYTNYGGVRQAINEFMDDKPEAVLFPCGSQAVVVKQ
jgi:O-methyltransferase